MSLRESPQMFKGEDKSIHSLKANTLDEPKKDSDQFYFIKFRPNSASQSSKAKKLIQRLDRDQLRIKKKLEEAQSLERWNEFCNERREVHEEEWRIKYALAKKKRELFVVRLSLDKLCFMNKAYQPEPKGSCLIENEVDNHRLRFRMLHGCKSFAEERRLLKDIKASQKTSIKDCTDTFHPSYFLYYCQAYYGANECDSLNVEKLIMNSPVKGEIWNSLGSKKVLQCQSKILNDEIAKLMIEKSENRAQTECLERKYKKSKEEKESLNRQMIDLEQRKKEASELIAI